MPKLIKPRVPPKARRPLSAASWKILHDIDALLLDHAARDNENYATLRARLNKVPRAERGLDWTERVVALYCVKRMRTSRAAALKIMIRKLRLESNEEEALNAFLARLGKTLHPYRLTNHGLMLPFNQRDQDQIAKDLQELFSLLQELGYPAFINSGTLLGAVREGKFLGHDDDADFAVALAGETDAEIVASLKTLHDQLNASGRLQKPVTFHKSGLILTVTVGSGIDVDLFPLWFRHGKAYIWPHTYGTLQRDDIFPLSQQQLCGAAMPAPNDPEKMLAINYGPNWRTPDPDFFFQWDDAKQKFAAILDQAAQSVNHSMVRRIKNWWKR